MSAPRDIHQLDSHSNSTEANPTMVNNGNYTTTKTTFPSHGETCAGILCTPTGKGPFPAVVLLGPYSFQKEQAPLHYACRLADEGYVALAFDPRTVGESTGTPRRLENPKMKNEVGATVTMPFGFQLTPATGRR